ncbi:putative WD repeat-containing protein alr3466 [Nostoc sp, PCC 7120] [Rhizoctonia solani]|uniref:Putative WD repeat-containing protein alr3466 [Nostoc sp, PCC 7120] n=1 Tax=Rhizoctonia solani TaxID=456999 RepID=A0A0K6G2D1_9AGAM|nr:putative WD repeat-containing protein alr3466 [Nostoc sp, PCC 7120] [Rhizoctonia solani]
MSVLMLISHEARAIKAAANRSPLRNQNIHIMYKEEMMQHYRRIGPLFRQLQGNLKMNQQDDTLQSSWEVIPKRSSLATLATHDSNQLVTNRRTCAQGTQTDVLARLDEWLNDSQSRWILWANGLPGTGKTTIAYTLCEEMRKQKLLAASFFCSRTTECSDVGRIIPTIAHQLGQYSIPFRSALSDVVQHDPVAGSNDLRLQFEQLLKKPLQKVKDTIPDLLVVVIDALDECSDRRGAELILDSFIRYAPDMKLKFLVTSRPMTDVHARIMTSYIGCLGADFLYLDDIDRSLVRADIKRYLAQELQHLSSSEIDTDQLVEFFGVSFLYAARLVSYVQSPEQPLIQQERLRSLIDMTLGRPDWNSLVDSAYLDVLNHGVNDTQPNADGAKEIQMVLQAVLLAREPISVEIIGMLGGISSPKCVTNILHRLQSVLDHSSQTGLISTHRAFSGFISSKEQAGPYFCNPAKQSQVLAQRCFIEMKKKLRFNICKLESSFLLDEEVEDIHSRIQSDIAPSLAYACRYWVDHLALADNSSSTLTMLSEFLSSQLLFWMEVLNLRKELNIGVSALLKTKNILERTSSPPELTNFLNDAYIFVRDFADSPASRSTPHVYMSSLQLCPSSSAVYQVYARRICGWLQPPKNATKYRDIPRPAFHGWKIGSGVLSAAYSPDGSRVALGCEDGTVNICDAHTGLLLVGPLDGHSDWVRCVVFSPDGTYILSASSDCTIRKWDSVSGAPLGASFQGHTHPVKSIAFSPDGTRVVSGSWDNSVRIWNAQDGKPVSEPLEGHKWGINCVAFSPNNASIASGANDHTIRLWEPGNNIHRAQPLEGHINAVMSIVFTPDGSRLVSGSVDCSICVWDVKDGTLSSRFLQSWIHMIYSVAISPDGRLVASGSSDSTIKVWDIDTGRAVFGPMGHSSGIRTVAFSPDSTRLFSGSHESARSWDLRPGLEAPNFNPPPERQPACGPSTTQVLDRVSGSSGASEGSITGLSALRPEKRASRPPLSIVTSLGWLLERSHLAYIPEDAITAIHTVSALETNRFLMFLPEGWERKSKGWLVNHRSRLLVWLPESHGSCQFHSGADRQPRLIFWWLRYQELVGDQWPGGSGRLAKATDESSPRR